MWDPVSIKKVGSCPMLYTSQFEWSPDGQYVLAGVLFPRMKIDNGFKVIKYDGSILYQEQATGAAIELYQVTWRPVASGTYHAPLIVAKAVVEAPQAKAGKYVHPNARFSSSTVQVKKDAEGPKKYTAPQPQSNLPPGWDDAPKKKKKAKPIPLPGDSTPKNPPDSHVSQPSPTPASPSPASPTPASVGAVSQDDVKKQLKEANKQLKDIENLKKQHRTPDAKPLDHQQLLKLKDESEVRALIAKLKQLDTSKQ